MLVYLLVTRTSKKERRREKGAEAGQWPMLLKVNLT
jgi:hypothetical protein